MTSLYRNPTTYGRTAAIPAYQIAMCPVCWWPAVSVIEVWAKKGRAIKCLCERGHQWHTRWSGESELIRRPWVKEVP